MGVTIGHQVRRSASQAAGQCCAGPAQRRLPLAAVPVVWAAAVDSVALQATDRANPTSLMPWTSRRRSS
jgi:hypothetical protein